MKKKLRWEGLVKEVVFFQKESYDIQWLRRVFFDAEWSLEWTIRTRGFGTGWGWWSVRQKEQNLE